MFVSDLMMTRITGPFTPVSATDLDFAQKLRQLNLKVETVANGHGWTGKLDDFLKFLEQEKIRDKQGLK